MKKTIEIKKVGINGEGIGYLDRQIIFVPGALPGEEVIVDIYQKNRGYSQAKLLKVLKPAKNRCQVACSMYESCQGCNLMHLNYSSQLYVKKEAVIESLKKYTNYDVSLKKFTTMVGARNIYGYVTSVNLPIVTFKDRLTFGIYQRGSKYLTLMTNCIKHHPAINQCLDQIADILNECKCHSYEDKNHTGLRFLKMKLVGDKIQLVFITGKDGISEEVVNKISAIENVAGIFMSINTSRYQDFDEAGYKKLYGSSRLDWYFNNQKYLINVKSQLPENLDLIDQENKIVSSMLSSDVKIISLNCNLALLELNLNQEQIVAIDEKNYHIEDCKLNAKYLKRDNVTFINGKIDDKIVTLAKKKIYDTLIIHGKRDKLSPKVIETIKLARFKTIIYLSGSHFSLAKDIANFEKYYSLQTIAGIDTSCHNTYMTTIVKLDRK